MLTTLAWAPSAVNRRECPSPLTPDPSPVVRSAGTIGFATFISRLLGFLRDVVIARMFGTSAAAQAFAVAFRWPNVLRDLVGEGAASAAFVPVLTATRKRSAREFWVVTGIFFNGMAVALAALALIGTLAAPWIVRVTAPGFLAEPAQFALTVRLTRWLFPYLWFIGLTALSTGVLNSLHHFAAPAWGPCLLNLAMIGCVLILSPYLSEPVLSLAIGVLIGGALQLWAQLPLLSRLRQKEAVASDPVRQPWWVWHPAISKALALLGPRALGSCVYQVNLLVDTVCASLGSIVGPGAVAALYYANRLFQFPLGIVGAALAQASLPLLSAQALDASPAPLKASLVRLLRMTVCLAIPATVGLALLGDTIVRVLFERGEFTAYSTAITTQALVWYSLGLAAYMGVKILTNTCYALQDTRTPVRTAAVALCLNIGLNLALMRPMGVGGLALATSLSSACNFALLWRALWRRLGPWDAASLWASIQRAVVAASCMGASCVLGRHLLSRPLTSPSTVIQALALVSLIAVGIGIFVGTSRLLHITRV